MILDEKKLKAKENIHRSARHINLFLLHQGEPIYMHAWGMSMYPFIKSGDKLKITPVTQEDISIGDIVALSHEDVDEVKLVIHRVIQIFFEGDERIVRTKGDYHSDGFDDPIRVGSIVGRIRHVQRKNIKFNFEKDIWKYINKLIARCSLKCPSVLIKSAKCISLLLEWKLFMVKVSKRMRYGDPLLHNSEELFLLCIRENFDEACRGKSQRVIHSGLNWQEFTQIVMKSGLTVRVYNALKQIYPYARIPSFVFEKLRAAYLYIESKSHYQHGELKELLKIFSEKNIDVLALKGSLLSKNLYGDIGLRGASIDLDLLVKEEDRKRAHGVLEELGYRCSANQEIPQWRWQNIFIKDEATMIDLQWDITMMMRTEERIKGLWQGVRRIDTEKSQPSLELEEEELLLYLCAHLISSNALGQMRYIADIARILDKYQDVLSWEDAIDKARSWKLSNSLYTGVLLARDLMCASVPEKELRKITPSFFKRSFIGFFANRKTLLRRNARRKFMDIFLSYVFFELVEARTFGEYISVFKRIVMPPKDVMRGRSAFSRLYKGLIKTIEGVKSE